MAKEYVAYDGPIVSKPEARAAGLKRFFTGIPCKHGHIAQRIVVNGSCWPCANARTKALRPAWYARNKERINAKAVDYRDPAKQAAYYLANRAAIREQQRLAIAANPEANRKRAAEWAKLNQEAVKITHRKWVEANPEKIAAEDHKRRARKLNAEGKHTAAEVLALLGKQRFKCVYCGVSIKKGYHKDHIVSLAKGGTNWIANIQLTCGPCNHRKSATDPIVFARRIGLLI